MVRLFALPSGPHTFLARALTTSLYRGILIAGSSILGGGVRAPRITTKNLMSIIFCEIAAVYGLIVSIILFSKVAPLDNEASHSADSYYTGFAIFWSGITVGACSLICGVTVGIIGSSAALADAADPTLYDPDPLLYRKNG